MTQLGFISVGFDHIVCANRVLAIINPGTVSGRRVRDIAKDSGKLIDACLGKSIKSLVLLDEGLVIISHISAKTLRNRLSGNIKEEDTEDEGD